ncbi:glycosyltransferase family 2 protein [Natronosporangium hydrolyticum]|uniref:Glycosyltransferase family 2 protein n=1 Tax=Natronosporangium hydrolyticum TaxID=2811111 RepID=A0A895YE27_9ACTN|nr:glycosyltransferase family 2 protein [Natronosporangium hydrolyticum]QSB14425.1 glycosyltransferase family 2 protein [Natronosporangium hydrolyticum]
MASVPEVSVIVPTRSRPALVCRAVRGALAQTVTNIEVIVVVDGPDQETIGALSAIRDHRVRAVELPAPGGAPTARNHGVRLARAAWTALLDDDDEWLPEKLAVQLKLAAATSVPTPIVASRLINRTPRADLVVPRRLPDPDQPISEYLTVRHGLFHGDGFVQTSTILTPTELLRRVPFIPELRRLQELDWTLRAVQHDGVALIVAPEPLVIWNTDEDRPRITFDSPWEESLGWLQRSRPLFTRRAYAAITMSVISSMAAPTRSVTAFRTLLREARRHGQPGALDYLTFLQIWLTPAQLRRRVRDLMLKRRRPAGGTLADRPAAPAEPLAGRRAD